MVAQHNTITPCLILLIGISSSGKSTFAKDNFANDQILSSDKYRQDICGDELNMGVNDEVFKALNNNCKQRIDNNQTTVIDAMNILIDFRQPIIQIAKDIGFPMMAFVMDTPLELCITRNKTRPNRQFEETILHEQYGQFRVALRDIESEGFQLIKTI